MLDLVYYPISFVLWFWREALTFVGMPHDAGLTWVLAIILLTVTVKALLVAPTMKSMRSSLQMQKIGPKIQELRKRYKNDKTKMQLEIQKLQKESGFNPLMGCLPMLVQMPIFFGMFHVLRSFNRVGEGFGGQGLTAEQNRQIGNYYFSPEDVQSFLDARFFGVPLSATIGMPTDQYVAFQPVDFDRLSISLVAVPLILGIVAFTHLNARFTVARQRARIASGKQTQPTGDNAELMAAQQEMMSRMMLWVFPALTIFTSPLWSIGLLTYMLTNSAWTFIQSRLLFGALDREEEAEEEQRREEAKASAPAVGARTVDRRSKKQRKLDAQRSHPEGVSEAEAEAARRRAEAELRASKKKKK